MKKEGISNGSVCLRHFYKRRFDRALEGKRKLPMKPKSTRIERESYCFNYNSSREGRSFLENELHRYAPHSGVFFPYGGSTILFFLPLLGRESTHAFTTSFYNCLNQLQIGISLTNFALVVRTPSFCFDFAPLDSI